MNDLSIDTAGQTSFEPGAPIKVEARWNLESAPEAVALRVVWNTAGRGDLDVQIVDTIRIESPSADERRALALTLPREPYSFSGQLCSLVWALELVALPSLASTRREIIIGPGAKAVNLLQPQTS